MTNIVEVYESWSGHHGHYKKNSGISRGARKLARIPRSLKKSRISRGGGGKYPTKLVEVCECWPGHYGHYKKAVKLVEVHKS